MCLLLPLLYYHVQPLEEHTLDAQFPQELPFLLIDLWVKLLQEGIPENEVILPQVSDVEVLEVFLSLVDDPESTVMGHFSPLVFCPIYIEDLDFLRELVSSYSQLFPGSFVHKVFHGSTI